MVSKTENREYASGWKNWAQEVENSLLQVRKYCKSYDISSLMVKKTTNKHEITLNIGQNHQSMQRSR